jgi:DNA topoisomerase II
MVWTKNMSTHGAAEVSNYSGKDFVKVRFYPDLKLFKMERLDEFTVGLFRRRVFDMAGIFGTAVKVSFNG